MTADDRRRWSNRYSVRLSRARVVDPIENLDRLVNAATSNLESAHQAALSMRVWLECIDGLEFHGQDAQTVNNARRLVAAQLPEVA